MWIGMSKLGYDDEAEIDDPKNVQWYWIPNDGTAYIDTSRYGGSCMDLYGLQKCDEFGNVLPDSAFGEHSRKTTLKLKKWNEKKSEWQYVMSAGKVKTVERFVSNFHNMDFDACLFAEKAEDVEKMNKWQNGWHRDNYKVFYLNQPRSGGKYVDLATRRAEKTARNKEIIERQSEMLRKRARGHMYSCWGSGSYPIESYVEKEFGANPMNRVVVLSALYHTYPYKFEELKAKMPNAIACEDEIYAYCASHWGEYGKEIILQFMSEARTSFSSAYYNSIGGDSWVDRDGRMHIGNDDRKEEDKGDLYLDENNNLKRKVEEAA
jgi:hypothetical protein